MISLCIDARMLGHSGIGRYLKNVIVNLNPNLFDLRLIMDSKADFKTVHGSIPCKFPIYSLREQLLLPSKVRPCDLFWSPHFNVPLLPVRSKRRVVTIHDLYHLTHFKKLSFTEKAYVKLIIPHAIKNSDKIITVSNFSRSEILKFFPSVEGKISVIENCVDKKIFYLPKDLKIIREKYCLNENFFLFVGNFKEHKNIGTLIRAFALFLRKSSFNANLIIVGKKIGLRNFSDVELLIKKEKIEKNVRIINDLSDDELKSFYCLSKALIFPSFYEGFGLPALEAMVLRTPVIASNIPSLKEVCAEGALYFDPHSSDELASAMEKMCDENERERYIRLGSKREKSFSFKKSIELHERLFRELCE